MCSIIPRKFKTIMSDIIGWNILLPVMNISLESYLNPSWFSVLCVYLDLKQGEHANTSSQNSQDGSRDFRQVSLGERKACWGGKPCWATSHSSPATSTATSPLQTLSLSVSDFCQSSQEFWLIWVRDRNLHRLPLLI